MTDEANVTLGGYLFISIEINKPLSASSWNFHYEYNIYYKDRKNWNNIYTKDSQTIHMKIDLEKHLK